METTSPALPSGRVTFAFIDVVGSTRTFLAHGDDYVAAVTALHAKAAEHAAGRGGVVVETEGDGAFLAFPSATAAVDALSGLQDELETASGDGLHLRIRSGAHTGDAVPVAGKYLALPVYVAARVAATANAGQILVSDEVLEELMPGHELAAGAIDTGTYQLKDLTDPLRIWRLAGDATPPRATPARRTNVEQSRTTFLGRDEEVDRLRRLAAEPGLITVVGPGGAGKTRLVSELALADAEQYDGGIWLVELATLDNPDQITPTIGSVLGLTTTSTAEVAGEMVRRGRSVLVIDNCEHLLDPVVAVVEELVGAGPEVTVICTSREALALAGERVLPLIGLPAGSAGSQLYLDRAAMQAREENDLRLVEELCAELDGLPLAIELAASQARSAPLADVLEAIRSGREALERRGGELRQRSLDAVLDWSLCRLAPAARDSLLTLAVFPGRFTPEMARAVLASAPRCDPEAARELARASLIDLDGTDYRLLSTVRAAALRALADDPELDRQARDALATWAAAFGEERFAVLTFHEDVPTDTFLAVQAALQHATDVSRPGMGKAWNFVAVVVGVRGASPELITLAERASVIDTSDAREAWTPVCAVNLLDVLHQEPPSDASRFEGFVELARLVDDPRLQLSALNALAKIRTSRGDLDGALACQREAVQVAMHPEATHNLSWALGLLGVRLYERGEFGESEAVALQAAEAARETGNWMNYCTCLVNASELAMKGGRPAQAHEQILEALKRAKPEWRLRGWVLMMLALVHLRLGDRPACVAAGRMAIEALQGQPDLLAREDFQEMFGMLPEEIWD